jgi:hypothetical protein
MQSEIDLQQYSTELDVREKELVNKQEFQRIKEQEFATANSKLIARQEILEAAISRFQEDHQNFQHCKYRLLRLAKEDERLWGEEDERLWNEINERQWDEEDVDVDLECELKNPTSESCTSEAYVVTILTNQLRF